MPASPTSRAVHDQLEQAQLERQMLQAKMNRAVEEERRRLAADLHNRPLQELAGVGYQLERVSMALDRGDVDGAREMVDEAAAELIRQIEAMRVIMSDLRPPSLDDNGLLGALEVVKARMRVNHPDLGLSIQGDADRLGTATETIFYRVAQEALTVMVGSASMIAVTISTTDTHASMTIVGDTPIDVESRNAEIIATIEDRLSLIDGSLTIDAERGEVRCSAPHADLTGPDA